MVKACLDWPTCIIPRDKATDLVFEKNMSLMLNDRQLFANVILR